MNRSQKIQLSLIAFSGLAFIIGLLLKNIYLVYIAYLISGAPVIKEAFSRIIRKQFLDENFLITIASLGAIYVNEVHEAVGVMLFYGVGQVFEKYAVNNSRKSIAELMDIAPDKAIRINGNLEESIAPEEIERGDILLVKPGEKIPVDGVVIDGTSSLNTSALTGESVPVDVSEGSKVISGSVNITTLLKIEAEKEYEDSTVAQILEMVENAASRKAPVEKFISKFAKYYTPAVVITALIMALVPPLLLKASLAYWIDVAAKFLVISCPCALVISVPLSLFAGVGSASKHGILVKGSNYLEAMSKLNTVAFDKTGTITTGQFEITSIQPAHGVKKDQLIKAALYGEYRSNHPIAKAIVKGASKCVTIDDFNKITSYEEISGKGTYTELYDSKIYCGNKALMDYLNIDISSASTEDNFGSTVYVAADNIYLGKITVSDEIRSNCEELIRSLKSFGIKNIAMLSGDKRNTAENTALQVGIDKVYAELLPKDKVKIVEEIISKRAHQGDNVAFIGDGINDAPVLARADIGIAMGALGSDAAIEAADIVIMSDDLLKLKDIISISKKTLRICKGNIYFAILVKFGVLALSPFGFMSMWGAVFADVGVAIIAIINSMRALKL